MLILPRNIKALACCAGACLQSFCAWGFFDRRYWGIFNRRKLGNIQPALTLAGLVFHLRYATRREVIGIAIDPAGNRIELTQRP